MGRGKKYKVLIVDDSSTNNLLFQTILEENGYEVEVAAEAEQARILLEKKSFSLILLDIMMPGMDGLDLLKIIRAQPKMKNIPVLVISAKDDKSTQKQAIDLNVIDYMPKPVGPKELLDKIKSIFTNQ